MPGQPTDMNIPFSLPTELLCLSDTYLLNATSSMITAIPREDGLFDVVMDRTIFYPKGGGQPSDTGRIIFANGEFEVKGVTLNSAGIAVHTSALVSGQLPVMGDSLELEVCGPQRLLNARNHTAGHVIDLAVQLLPMRRDALKANHSPTESWIQFNGDHLPSGQTLDEVKQTLSEKVTSLLQAGLKVKQFTPTSEEIAALNMTAPAGKSVRLVAFEGYENFARGCGGTHVRATSEIESVVITGVRARKGVLSITYETRAHPESADAIRSSP